MIISTGDYQIVLPDGAEAILSDRDRDSIKVTMRHLSGNMEEFIKYRDELLATIAERMNP